MRRFFIEQSDVNGPAAIIKGSDSNHIKNVLRLRLGDKIGLFDGTGYEYESRITAFSPGKVELQVLKKFPSTTESPLHLTVAQAFLKDKKMDGLVRQVTELGITEWLPFMANRSVPRPDAKRLAARTQRWEKIAKEALKQCKRGRIPQIGPALSFEEILNLKEGYDLNIVFWENESSPMTSFKTSDRNPPQKILIVLGPEGGFSLEEIKNAKSSGFVTASLGPRILRAETAAIAACTLIQYLFGDMAKKSS